MAMKYRRMIAWIVALVLCAGQIAVPVNAGTVEPSTTAVEGGTQTITVQVDENGTQVTTTQTSTADPDQNTTFQSTTTEAVSSIENGVNVDTTWNSTTTQTGSETQNGNPTVQTDTTTITTVTGSETTTEISYVDSAANAIITEGSNQGEETTIITDTTVTTTTTTDVLLSDEDSSKTDTTSTTHHDSSSTGWENGDVTEGQWQQGQVQQGEAKTTESQSGTTKIDASNPGEATIHMTPDGKTETVQVDVTIDQVLAGMEIPEGAVEIKKDGKVIGYKIVTVTETSVQDPNPTVSDTTEIRSAATEVPVAPKGYQEETDKDGNVTTVTEAIRDSSGNIIGYRVTKTTVTEAVDSNTSASNQQTTTTTTAGEDTFVLPSRPEAALVTNADGSVTETVVEEILEDGKVVGYKSITTYFNDKGEPLRTESNSIYGTSSSSTTQVQRDPETETETTKTTTTETQVTEIYTTEFTRDVTLVTERTNNITTTILTEEDTYQLVETEDGMFFLYKGTMQPVVALAGHGTVDLEGLKPTARPSAANDLASYTAVTNPPKIVNPGAPGSDQFKYVDYGLISDFRVTKSNGGNTSEVHLYKLVDKDGNAYYAYCADLDTTAYRNTIYDISNANDANYYQNNQDQDAYAHLLAIAINGYWGTSSGTGSMAAIKKLLIDNGRSDIAATITDGEAMTATQAAIWTFGNKSSTNLVNTSNPAANVSDRTSRKNIEALYDILISDALKKNTKNEETDIIQEKDITGTTLELKGKATDKNGTVKTDSKGNEKYNADLTFTMAVEESALTGNLKLVVKDQNGNKLCDDIQLVTENSNFLGHILADGSGYSYTIKDLEIAEGVTINLNLEGYQNLKKGVYIYTAATGSHEDSQTFIGIAEGTRDVNLQTKLTFTVEDPQMEHHSSSRTQVRTDTRVDRKEDHRTDTRTDTQENTVVTVTVVTDTNVKTYGTETVTETRQDVTKKSRSWETRWKNSVKKTSDDPTEPTETVLITDEPVPLAKAPRTGDVSGLWILLGGISLAGMGLLNRKRKDEE